MFDRLLDVILSFLDQILPVAVVNQTDKGVRLRFGKFKEVLNPGWHFKISFVDEVLKHTVL